MAGRGFSCPNCHTWFEGEGNHPRCPNCGRRASPRDLLDSRHRPEEPFAGEARVPRPDYEVAPEYGMPRDYEMPRDHEMPHDYETAPELENRPDYDVPAPPRVERRSQPPSRGERAGPDSAALIGALIFIAIVASRVCSALAG
jgi:hypothetical protein